MQKPGHELIAARTGMPSARAAGVGFVVLVHVALLTAIVNGLVPGLPGYNPPPIDTKFFPADPPKPPPPGPLAHFLDPNGPTATLPDVPPTGPEGGTGINVGTNPPGGGNGDGFDSAHGIAGTHTTPPYPALDQRLGTQGTVRLKLTISPLGTVSTADVERSSGSETLDAAAVAWVVAHWRYRPANQSGVAVASTAEADVVFNLHNAR
jgi:protein TonB